MGLWAPEAPRRPGGETASASLPYTSPPLSRFLSPSSFLSLCGCSFSPSVRAFPNSHFFLGSCLLSPFFPSLIVPSILHCRLYRMSTSFLVCLFFFFSLYLPPKPPSYCLVSLILSFYHLFYNSFSGPDLPFSPFSSLCILLFPQISYRYPFPISLFLNASSSFHPVLFLPILPVLYSRSSIYLPFIFLLKTPRALLFYSHFFLFP